MKRMTLGVFLSLTVLASVGVAVSAQRPVPTIFEGGRVIIGDGRVIENGALVVDKGKLTAVGPMGAVKAPAGATHVDLTGKTVMPALVDAHMHMGYENMLSWRAENYTRDNIIDTLNRLAYYGIGAVISTGSDPNDRALAIQREQAAGTIGGTRFLFAAGFGPPGQGPNQQLLDELAKFHEVVVRGITNDADARQGVREVAAKGIKFVKVWVTDRGGTQKKTTPEAYRALIDEAHKHHMVTLAHAVDTLADAKDLARAGLDISIHGVLDADAEYAALMKKNDGTVTPAQGLGWRNIPGEPPWYEDPFFREATPPATLARYRAQTAQAAERGRGDAGGSNAQAAGGQSARGGGGGFTPQPFEQQLARAIHMIQVLQAGGVRIAIGTDSGAVPDFPPGYPVHREMELETRMGMTPAQVIVAATKSGAEALRLDKEMGTLEVGKVANLLILNANPLTDIKNTRKVAAVYLQGKEIDRASLRKTWNPTGTQ